MQPEGFEILFKTWSASESGTDQPCQLAMTLCPGEGPGTYLRGTLSVEKVGLRLAFPLTIEPRAVRTFLDEARSLNANHLDGEAVLYDYDYQRVLALTWVPLQPPILVMSGDYTSYLIPEEDQLRNLPRYPYQAQDAVQYSGIVITLADVDRFVSELQSGIDELGRPWSDRDGE